MYIKIKRALDIIIAFMAILAVSPIFLFIIPILRVTGEGKIYFRQIRIGCGKKPFILLKFASMLEDSPKTGTITSKNDPRILPFGKFLRMTKINELPQIINVLRGDMSIVGPRPQTQECFDYYSDEVQARIYDSRPGLTGIGSVVFRNEEELMSKSNLSLADCYRQEIMPYKGALELWYLENKSLFVDIKIIILTAIAILFPNSKLTDKWFENLPERPQIGI